MFVCVHDVCVRDVRAAAASYQSDQQAFAFISMMVTKADMTWHMLHNTDSHTCRFVLTKLNEHFTTFSNIYDSEDLTWLINDFSS